MERSTAELRRTIILAYVSVHPCCNLRAVAYGTGMPLAMARYHAEYLQRQALLGIDRAKTWWCLYLPGTVMAEAVAARAIADPELWTLWAWMHTQRRLILEHIVRHATRYWHWSRSTTRNRLRRLLEAGLLIRVRDNGAAHHQPAEPRFRRHDNSH